MPVPQVQRLTIRFEVPEEGSEFHGLVRESESKDVYLRFSKGGDAGRYFVDVPFSETLLRKLIDDMHPVAGQHFTTLTLKLPYVLEGPGTAYDERTGQRLKDSSEFN